MIFDELLLAQVLFASGLRSLLRTVLPQLLPAAHSQQRLVERGHGQLLVQHDSPVAQLSSCQQQQPQFRPLRFHILIQLQLPVYLLPRQVLAQPRLCVARPLEDFLLLQAHFWSSLKPLSRAPVRQPDDQRLQPQICPQTWPGSHQVPPR